MGHISEPNNIDLQINSGELTEEDIQLISSHIAKSKLKKKSTSKSKTSKSVKEYAE